MSEVKAQGIVELGKISGKLLRLKKAVAEAQKAKDELTRRAIELEGKFNRQVREILEKAKEFDLLEDGIFRFMADGIEYVRQDCERVNRYPPQREFLVDVETFEPGIECRFFIQVKTEIAIVDT